MLKVFLVIIIFFSSCSKAVCQLEKGTWLVGGNGFFSRSNNSYGNASNFQISKSTSLKLSPNVGYFFTDKFGGGLKAAFSFDKIYVSAGVDGKVRRFEFGPFVRYYFLEKEKELNIVSEVSYQYGLYKDPNFNGTINTLSLLAGPVLYFNSSVGIEFLVGYNSRVEDVKQAYKDSRKSFQVAIGFQIHLQK